MKKKWLKRIIVLGGFLAVLGGLLWIIVPKTHPIDAVPQVCPLAVYMPLAQDTNTVKFLWNKDYEQLEEWKNELPAPASAGGWAALFPVEKGRYKWLIIQDASKIDYDIEELLKIDSSATYTVYRNRQIYHYQKSYFVCQDNGLLIWSSVSLLVEEAIRQLDLPKQSWYREQAFRKGLKNLKQDQWNIFIRGASCQIAGKYWPFPANLLGDQFDWLHLYTTRDTSITFSGNRYQEEHFSKATDLGAIFNTIPRSLEMTAIHSYQYPNSENSWSSYVTPWAKPQLAYGLDAQKNVLIWIPVADSTEVDVSLGQWKSEQGIVSESSYQSFDLVQVQSQGVFKGLLGDSFPGLNQPFLLKLPGYVCLSDSRVSIELFINNFIVNNMLGQDIELLQFLNRTEKEKGGFFQVSNTVIQKPRDGFLERLYALQDAQFIFGQDQSFVAKLSQRPLIKQSSIQWQKRLPKPIVWGPKVVKDQQFGDKVLVQDEGYEMYAFELDGSLAWQQQLDGVIMSDIYALDLTHQNEANLVFHTRNRLYAFDKQGIEVSPFPLDLTIRPSSAMTVIDFFKNKNFNFLIGNEFGAYNLIDRRGKQSRWWSGNNSIGAPKFPVEHFQYGNQDYFLILNTQSQLKVINRRGRSLMDSITLQTRPLSGPSFQLWNNGGRIVVPESNGYVHIRNLLGEGFRLKLGNGTDTHFLFDQVIGDWRNDYVSWHENSIGVYSYEGQDFKMYHPFEFEAPLDTVFSINAFPDTLSRIGASIGNKIYLLDIASKRIHPDFPLGGSGIFEVIPSKDGRITVLAKQEDQLISYEISN